MNQDWSRYCTITGVLREPRFLSLFLPSYCTGLPQLLQNCAPGRSACPQYAQ